MCVRSPLPLTIVFHSVTQLCGVYKEGEVQFDSAWLYLAMINSLSQGVSSSTWWVGGWVGACMCVCAFTTLVVQLFFLSEHDVCLPC